MERGAIMASLWVKKVLLTRGGPRAIARIGVAGERGDADDREVVSFCGRVDGQGGLRVGE